MLRQLSSPCPFLVAALLAPGAVLLSPGAVLAVDPLEVRHEPILCVLSERYPQLDACVEPLARVGSVHAYFRSAAGETWRHVEMKPVGECYRATLPAPLA